MTAHANLSKQEPAREIRRADHQGGGRSQEFGSFHALRGVNMTVQPGEVVVIIGPSGSGKSTFIRTINRLEAHDKGTIIVDGIELKDGQNLDAIRREVGMVFQSFNLFPHLTVLQNVSLAPIRVRKTPKAQAEQRAMEC